MKRIIYTAVALIICASAFGIADYLNAKKQGTLVNYTHDELTPKVIVPEKKKEIATVKEEPITANTKKFKKESELVKKSFKSIKKSKSPHVKVYSDVTVTEITKDASPEKKNVMEVLHSNTADEYKTDTTSKVNNKRKINLEMFSRAPIGIKKSKK